MRVTYARSRADAKPGLCICGCGERYKDVRSDRARTQYKPGHHSRHLGIIVAALRERDNKTFAAEASKYVVATVPTQRDGTTDTYLELDDLRYCLCACGQRSGGHVFSSGHHTRVNHNLVHALMGGPNRLLDTDGDVIDPEDALAGWRYRYEAQGVRVMGR